jgi:hypothetical protein
VSPVGHTPISYFVHLDCAGRSTATDLFEMAALASVKEKLASSVNSVAFMVIFLVELISETDYLM